jgi:hypothetical protein
MSVREPHSLVFSVFIDGQDDVEVVDESIEGFKDVKEESL